MKKEICATLTEIRVIVEKPDQVLSQPDVVLVNNGRMEPFNERSVSFHQKFERLLKIPADKVFDFVNWTFNYIPLGEKL